MTNARGPGAAAAAIAATGADAGPWHAPSQPLPQRWWLMAVAMLIMLGFGALGTRTFPPLVAGSFAVGMLIAAASHPVLARLDRDLLLSERTCLVVMLVAVGAPLACLGLGVADWTLRRPTLASPAAGAMLGATALFATIMLERRRGAVVVAYGSLWLGVELRVGSWYGGVVALAGLVAAALVAARQAHAAVVAAEQSAAATRRLQRAEAILTEFEETGQGWFWESDRRGTLTYVSPTIAAMLGQRDDDLVGRPLTALFDLGAQGAGADAERTLTFHLSARSAFQDVAVRAAMQDGAEQWWSVTARPVHDAYGNFQGFRGSGSDLTERRKSHQRVSWLARSDALTGLGNRVQMAEALERILVAPREEQRACAVFLLDLDRFKQVNDTLGHPAGDALLKHVAQRLERCVDQASRVGRLGGDEFQVILPGRIPADDLGMLAQRIIETLTQPYAIDGHRVTIGASVGIAIAPRDGLTSEELIRNADLALYAAKDGGRGRHHFYSRDLHSEAERRRQLEHELRDAMASGGLALRYQPVVHTASEAIVGFEALLHWQHPVLGVISPALFVPVAEEAGLIEQIGEWALRTACAELAGWPAGVRCAVNVSPRQFGNPALPAIVTSALAGAQIAADRLELEITESVFLGNDSGIDATFASLKRLGVRLALDDFGTGYSSLSYLQKYPFDKIKIDQSFVRGATEDGSRNGAIIASIVSLAAALDMETTAEGVETHDQLDLIRELGCSHIQGYIYRRPLSAAEAAALLVDGGVLEARGPRSTRAARHATLRAVELVHAGGRHIGVIRNVSDGGALIESDWEPPEGLTFRIVSPNGETVDAVTCWARDCRIGATLTAPRTRAASVPARLGSAA